MSGKTAINGNAKCKHWLLINLGILQVGGRELLSVDTNVVTGSQATTTIGLVIIAFVGRVTYVDNLSDLIKVNPFSKALILREISIGVAHLYCDHQDQKDMAIISYELMSRSLPERINGSFL